MTDEPLAVQSVEVQLCSIEGMAVLAHVGLLRPEDQGRLDGQRSAGRLHLCVGDRSEVTSASSQEAYVNAVIFDVDTAGGEARVRTSLVGLPPVFVSEQQGRTTISCPFHPIAEHSNALDIEGVADTLRWGHPLYGRTLLAAVRLAAADTVLHANRTGCHVLRRTADIDPTYLGMSDAERLEAQVGAFESAGRRLPVENAFLSLSGGIDSRAALVAVLNSGRRMPCVTFASSQASLDARLAASFCKGYGLEHHIVDLSDPFLERLPELVLRSARLGRGVVTLAQTIDLHLYDALPFKPTARISGNLGNQVGRGGVESISVMQPNTRVLGPELRAALERRPLEPWYLPRMRLLGYGRALFTEEVSYWSVANYSVGSAHAAQLTPYSSRALIELACARFERDPEFGSLKSRTFRKRDLKHRIAGPRLQDSFQRTFLARHDGRGREVPINWGWLAAGGWSPRWMTAAGIAAADTMLQIAARRAALSKPLHWMSSALGGPSAPVAWPIAFDTRLKEMARDVLLSSPVKDSGLVDFPALRRLIDGHFSGRTNAYATLAPLFEMSLVLAETPDGRARSATPNAS